MVPQIILAPYPCPDFWVHSCSTCGLFFVCIFLSNQSEFYLQDNVVITLYCKTNEYVMPNNADVIDDKSECRNPLIVVVLHDQGTIVHINAYSVNPHSIFGRQLIISGSGMVQRFTSDFYRISCKPIPFTFFFRHTPNIFFFRFAPCTLPDG